MEKQVEYDASDEPTAVGTVRVTANIDSDLVELMLKQVGKRQQSEFINSVLRQYFEAQNKPSGDAYSHLGLLERIDSKIDTLLERSESGQPS